MGLDVYAGTLTRYYAHNWKTIVQQEAEAEGHKFVRVESVPDNAIKEISKIQKIIKKWQDNTYKTLKKNYSKKFAPWKDDNEKPYYTHKPDWTALKAMLLVAAGKIYNKEVPKAIAYDWDYTEDELIDRLSSDENIVYSMARGVELWLPIAEPMIFAAELPTGDDDFIGTVGGLRRELEEINKMVWQADEKTILSWIHTEGYIAVSDGTGTNSGKYDTAALAKFAYSIMWQAMRFAENNQVPILLDY